MTPEEWNKVKALFDAALLLEPSQRAAFLAEDCPDDSLRREVEKLLINFQEVGSRLSNPVFHPDISTHGHTMIGRHLGVYKLERRIGQGGMAAVFLATRADGEFSRQVAIKLLLPGLDSDEVLSRFRRERQTLAALDHANIVKLLDGGSTPEGLPYLVMDYVEGSPIDEYCDTHKLSIEQRLRLFGKVCEAVQHAHEKLVIHRDLKPGNILITSAGVPKLLDFGIAKVMEPTAQLTAVTQAGARCMTLAYASPEQVRGKSVTAGTDIYSLGAVLYELLTGQRPYRVKDQTASELERAICEQEPEKPSTAVNRVERESISDGTILTRTPEVVSQVRESEPERLRRRLRGDLDIIVLKALEKEPERRYRSVEELGRDIDRHLRHMPVKARRSTLIYRTSKLIQRHKIQAGAAVAFTLVLAAAAWLTFWTLGFRDRIDRVNRIGTSPAPRIESIAVIPLANLSGDPAQEYFSDGMTDALITNLAQIGTLKVISRTSSMQYKQTNKSLPEVARELNVDGIIEGTVQRSGDRVLISTQLIHGPSDTNLWANSYERNVSDVFMLERELAGDIARQVQARLTAEKRAELAQRRTANPAALEAYLQGNSHLHKFSRGSGDEELRLASDYFQQAIDADPDFAPAYVGMSNARDGTLRSSSEDGDIATKTAERAVELDPNLSDAWTTLAAIKSDFFDWSEAEQDYRRALALNPNDGIAHEHLGWLLDARGRLDEGWKEAEIAQELDPNDDHLEAALNNRHEYDKVIRHITTLLDANPDDGFLHHQLYEGYRGKGMYKEAVQQLEQTLVLFGLRESAGKVRQGFAASGYRGAMRKYAEELEHLHATNQVFVPLNVAQAYAAVGDKDRAFYWLELAYKYRGHGTVGVGMIFLNRDPGLEPLRSDPRYTDLLRRVGLPR
jgi:serine/threonine protein kinase/tetratricopeptide (TPR) repeat protein